MKAFPVIPGCELYLCGGACRDYLLDKEPKDRDFVVITDYTFDELVEVIGNLPNAQVYLATPQFMTIRCNIDKEPIDICFPRNEKGYSDGRRPDNVERVNTLQEDALRRDFTINAMYMDKNGEIIDFYYGQEDLKMRRIVAVGNPDERFREDYLRILRAIRFSAKFDFEIEENTQFAMMWYIKGLANISTERIMDELNKSFVANPDKTINYIKDLDLLEVFKSKGIHIQLTNKQL